MSPMKVLIAAISLAAFCAPPAFAEAPSDDAAPHAWHAPNKEEMAVWHARMCNDRYARQAGRLAYLEASLAITDAQRGAFNQWRDAVLSRAKSRAQACLAQTRMPGHFPDVLERNANREKILEARLDALRSERPALEALYQSLTPEQKKLFDRAGDRFGRGHRFGEGFGQRRDGDVHQDHG